jgi:hypothetical protein
VALSISGVWCSSVGCNIVKWTVTQLSWVRRSSVGCGIDKRGVALLLMGYGVAQWGAA